MINHLNMAVKTFLVLDTNIWVYKTRLLNTSMGAALLYSLRQLDRILVLPEVVEMEIKKHTIKLGLEAVNRISENYKSLEQLMGVRDDYKVPEEVDFENRAKERIEELEPFIKRISLTLDLVRFALIRVMEETPPNGIKNQQFKDSVIWEHILQLAEEGNVDFVTEDKGFFKDRNPQKGLADNLLEDVEGTKGEIRVFNELSDYLKDLKEETPEFNIVNTANNIHNVLWKELNDKANSKGYKLLQHIDSQINVFLTEKPDILALEFILSYSTESVMLPGSDESIVATQKVKGDCKYSLSKEEVTDIKYDIIYLEDINGNKIPFFIEYFLQVGTGVIGRETIYYSFKEPL